LRTADFSARDTEGKVTFYVPLWKRKGISQELFDDYWRNVHGPVCARLPGQYQYWQFHVDPNDGGIWPTVGGIEYSCDPEDNFAGIAELTFKSVDDRNTWFEAAAILMDDEHNIFSKAIGYNTSLGNSKTFVDGIATGDPNGQDGSEQVRLFVLLKKQDSASIEEFRNYLFNKFAPTVVPCKNLLKLRVHQFDEVDNSRPPAAGVDHGEPPEKNYQAALEIAFADRLDMERFFASPEYTSTLADQPKYIKQLCTFPNKDAYTFVYDGQMTLAGQRSSIVAQLITRLGAVNQLQEDITQLMLNQKLS
jgi:EthD domain